MSDSQNGLDLRIRLRWVETVTNKLDGNQAVESILIDEVTGRRVEGFVGASSAIGNGNRILTVQLNLFGHEVNERREVAKVEDIRKEGVQSEQ